MHTTVYLMQAINQYFMYNFFLSYIWKFLPIWNTFNDDKNICLCASEANIKLISDMNLLRPDNYFMDYMVLRNTLWDDLMIIQFPQINFLFRKHVIFILKWVQMPHQSMPCEKLGTHCSCFNNCTDPAAKWPFRLAMSIKSSGSLYGNIDNGEKRVLFHILRKQCPRFCLNMFMCQYIIYQC